LSSSSLTQTISIVKKTVGHTTTLASAITNYSVATATPTSIQRRKSLAVYTNNGAALRLTASLASSDIVVASSALAFPVMVGSILAAVRVKRRRSYGQSQRGAAWGSIAAITGGGMLLVACLWQLGVTGISASLNRPWYIGRDWISFTGIFVSFALALFGAVRYNYRPLTKVSPARLGKEAVYRQIDFDERVYAYIKSEGGTISLTAASHHFGVYVTEIKASIYRLKEEGRITF